MADDDLIRRGDALQLCGLINSNKDAMAVDNAIRALPAVTPAPTLAEAAKVLLPIAQDRSAYPDINQAVMNAWQGSHGSLPRFWVGFGAALRRIAEGGE